MTRCAGHTGRQGGNGIVTYGPAALEAPRPRDAGTGSTEVVPSRDFIDDEAALVHELDAADSVSGRTHRPHKARMGTTVNAGNRTGKREGPRGRADADGSRCGQHERDKTGGAQSVGAGGYRWSKAVYCQRPRVTSVRPPATRRPPTGRSGQDAAAAAADIARDRNPTEYGDEPCKA